MDCVPLLFLLIFFFYLMFHPLLTEVRVVEVFPKAKQKAQEVICQIALMTILRKLPACLFGWHIMRLENE